MLRKHVPKDVSSATHIHTNDAKCPYIRQSENKLYVHRVQYHVASNNHAREQLVAALTMLFTEMQVTNQYIK